MSSLFKPGDLLKLEHWFYVYELVDDYGIVFYIGMSKDPAYRFRSHASPKHCDSEAVCQEIASCKSPQMRIVSAHPTKDEALIAEARRVRETPGVLNDPAKYIQRRKPARTAEYYRNRRVRRALRDASKGQEL